MKVVIYRNIKGKFQPKSFELWKSFARQLGFTLGEHVTKNTRTITVYPREEVTFTIFRSKLEPHLCLDYLRLEPANSKVIKLIDSLIQYISLSGEKQILEESERISTFFNEGKVVNADHSYDLSKFELLLLRETIFGFVHLSLDSMVKFQRSGNLERIAEIKTTFSDYQKLLNKLNEQINSK